MEDADTAGRARWPTEDELKALTDVVRRVARRARLSREDAQDFEQSVHLRMLERRYDVFVQFEERSALSTYLTTVVRRLLLDWRIRQHGKWRPSAGAVRLGRDAVMLERLIVRDGLSVREAIETLRCQGKNAAALEGLAEQMPLRPAVRASRRAVSVSALDEAAARAGEDPFRISEQRLAELDRRRAVAAAVRRLPPEDRRLLRARYRDGHTVQTVAAMLAANPKTLYRRFDRVLRTLRATVDGSIAAR